MNEKESHKQYNRVLDAKEKFIKGQNDAKIGKEEQIAPGQEFMKQHRALDNLVYPQSLSGMEVANPTRFTLSDFNFNPPPGNPDALCAGTQNSVPANGYTKKEMNMAK
ncbi:MAG: hypothetical protein L6R37_008074, partial [Teloschistes peruensis]